MILKILIGILAFYGIITLFINFIIPIWFYTLICSYKRLYTEEPNKGKFKDLDKKSLFKKISDGVLILVFSLLLTLVTILITIR